MTLVAAQAVFYYMAFASIVSAILAVTRKNPVHAILWVLALFLHIAGIFLLLGAEFLAAVQIIVYAGAILVFYLFVLMLLDVPDETTRARFGAHWYWAVAGGLAFFVLCWLALPEGLDFTQADSSGLAAAGVDSPPLGSLAEVGSVLFGQFALPFEIASLILLAAIVGSVVLAKRKVGS